ncbi:MAG: THxN family PEP-CTERM protein [Dechloromonas sp.]|nr:THxN family PEP-CTERM protein [Dechloromonas sp.]
MRKLLLSASLVLGTLALAAPQAQAAMVANWGYEVTSEWTGATFTAGTGTQIQTATEISWGGDNNGGIAGVGNLIVGGGTRSGVLIENTPQTGIIATNGPTPEPTNTFSHVNNPISSSFATLSTASISTTLTLTALGPPDFLLPPKTLSFDIKFRETLNDSSCVVGATSNCDDIFVITFGSLNQSFIFDGFEYFTSIVKTSGPLDPLDPTACVEAGATSPCLGFLTREGEKTSVDFGILITSRPLQIPEPGILGLMGLALLGAAVARRRQIR